MNFDSCYNGQYAKLQELKDCLMKCYERKAKVCELTLSQCRRLMTELVDELREIVVNVNWDGWVTGFSNVSEDDYGDNIDDSDDMYL